MFAVYYWFFISFRLIVGVIFSQLLVGILINVFQQSVADQQTLQGCVRLTLFHDMINNHLMGLEEQQWMQTELAAIAMLIVNVKDARPNLYPNPASKLAVDETLASTFELGSASDWSQSLQPQMVECQNGSFEGACKVLAEMGFVDVEQNISALQSNDDVLKKAIGHLILEKVMNTTNVLDANSGDAVGAVAHLVQHMVSHEFRTNADD